MAHLLYTEDEDVYTPNIVRTIYDPTCGTGGMLSVSEEYITRDGHNPDAHLELFGQEYNEESWAICCSDMLIKDEPVDNIAFGDTLGDGKTFDGHPDKKFHYMLANPPFGVEWKPEKDEVEKEYNSLGFKGRFGPGLTTGPIPDAGLLVTLSLDFCDHVMVAEAEGGARVTFPLRPMSVAQFFGRTKEAILSVGGHPTIHGVPNEVANPVPFAKDNVERPYDADAVRRFHHALVAISRVFERFRTGFLGKVSPVHLFWGSFDLAVTRFSGRQAPLHPGGVPSLPDSVSREAYSHEVSSAGFWPGGSGVEEAMFYSYAYPAPDGFRNRKIGPDEAWFDGKLGEFLLPYEAVRWSSDPESTLLRFLETTYGAAADTGRWPRRTLECAPGRPGIPRLV